MCSSYKEYSYIKMTEKQQGPSPGVHLRGVSVLKRVYCKMTKKRQRDRHQEVSVSERCPYYKEYSYSKMTEKRQGPTPGVRLVEVFSKQDATERTLRRRGCGLINCKCGGIVRNQIW